VDLERGPLSLVSTTEELLERKSSGSGLERREYSRRNSLCWPRSILYPQKLALTSPTSGCSSVGIVRLRTQATELFLLVIIIWLWKIFVISSNHHVVAKHLSSFPRDCRHSLSSFLIITLLQMSLIILFRCRAIAETFLIASSYSHTVPRESLHCLLQFS
jgi:hypothetical protein